MATAQVKLLVGQPVASSWDPIFIAVIIGTVQQPTATDIVVASDLGYHVVFHGTFTVVGSSVTGGTMTGFDVYAGTTKVMSGSGYATSGLELFDAIQPGNLIALDELLFNVPLKIVGSKMDDSAEGSDFADELFGRAGNDALFGWLGDDFIKGNKGNDFLVGDDGFDQLWGGPGDDVFGFQIDPLFLPVGYDRIKDFNKAGEDLIGLQIFDLNVPPGHLGEQYFHKGTAATTAEQIVIYDKSTGNIFFDVDGTGVEAQFQLAKVKAGTKLHADDFYVQSGVI